MLAAAVLTTMLSAVSLPNLLIAAKPKFFQKVTAKLIADDTTIVTDSATPSTKTSAKVAEARKADAEKSEGKVARRPANKTVVDQRVTDTPSMRITVISYSDGSSERLQEIKNVDQAVAVNAGLLAAQKAPAALTQLGMMIDKLA